MQGYTAVTAAERIKGYFCPRLAKGDFLTLAINIKKKSETGSAVCHWSGLALL
jgi:hypothetical protein